ncbi:MAG: hypothetical protein J6M93_03985 [Succinivibrio sp.]|nr:hypothetical protein [Succinivibrio sp.]
MIFKQERVIWHLKSAVTGLNGPDRDLVLAKSTSGSEKDPETIVVPSGESSVVKETEPLSRTGMTKSQPIKPAQSEQVVTSVEPAAVVDGNGQGHPYHLRKKRADVFISTTSKVDFVERLQQFLQGRGLRILPYDNTVHYLPYDVLLLAAKEHCDEGIVMNLDEGREAVWSFLKTQFGERL